MRRLTSASDIGTRNVKKHELEAGWPNSLQLSNMVAGQNQRSLSFETSRSHKLEHWLNIVFKGTWRDDPYH